MSQPAVKPSRWRSLGKGALSILMSFGVLFVGVAGFAALASLKKGPPKREPVERSYNVEVFAVERTDLREFVSSFGEARVIRQTTVKAQVSGNVQEKSDLLHIGKEIESDASSTEDESKPPEVVLIKIDPATYEKKRDAAQKRVNELNSDLKRVQKEEKNADKDVADAQKELDEYMKQYVQIETGVKQGAFPPSDLTKANLQKQTYEQKVTRAKQAKNLFPLRIKVLRDRIETAGEELKSAQLELDKTDVRAPFPGSIADVNTELGDFVRMGDPLFRLLDLSRVEVPVPVSLSDYRKIQRLVAAGQQPIAYLATSEIAEPQWTGRVTRVAPEANQKTRTINVFVEVDNSGQAIRLKPGVFVHALIDAGERSNVVAVPRDAIQQGKVFVIRDGKAFDIPVKVDLAMQNIAILAEGESLVTNNGKPVRRVSPGDRIVLTNLDVIRPGVALKERDSVKPHSIAAALERQRTKVLQFAKPANGTVPAAVKPLKSPKS